MRKNIIFAAVVLLVVTLLYVFSTEEIAPVPFDEEHLNKAEDSCQECHGEGEEHQLKKEHPPKYQCLQCHKHRE
jgi:hypothetical protein